MQAHVLNNIAGDTPAIPWSESKAKRGEWPLGRVMEVYPGDDGLVRVVRVKSKNKEFLRPVHCLCPLEYADDNPVE